MLGIDMLWKRINQQSLAKLEANTMDTYFSYPFPYLGYRHFPEEYSKIKATKDDISIFIYTILNNKYKGDKVINFIMLIHEAILSFRSFIIFLGTLINFCFKNQDK
jgi:hypothetical protein